MTQADKPECWPGTTIRKSTNNGFTLGHGDTPHGFVAGAPAVVGTSPPRKRGPRAPKAFGVLEGTMAGLGDKRI